MFCSDYIWRCFQWPRLFSYSVVCSCRKPWSLW